MSVTLDTIRADLRNCAEKYGMDFPPEVFEQNASVLRDAMVSMGVEPSDREILESMLLASFLCLGHVVNSVVSIGPALPLSFIQTQVLRMWLDGEMPILSMADVLELKAIEAMNPSRCQFVHRYEGGESFCRRYEGHADPHLVWSIEPNDDGGAILREIEIEEVA